MGAAASIDEAAHKDLYMKMKNEYVEGVKIDSNENAVSDTEFELFKQFVAKISETQDQGDLADDFDFSLTMTTPPSSENTTQFDDGKNEIAKYEEIKDVGRGAFAVAKLMRIKETGEYCVIKKMNVPMRDLSEREQNETHNEIAIMKQLLHPNIIQYQTDFVSKGIMHIVMEFADGGTLAKLIDKAAGKQPDGSETEAVPFADERIWEWLVQIAAALNHTHSQNILHRDMKPLNIMLTGKDQRIVKVGDFGIAKVLGNDGMANTVVGTPFYLSPELCEGLAYNDKSDVWALGCILFELLALRKAFTGTSIPALILSIMSGEYGELPEVSSCDAELLGLVARMLCLHADGRPALHEIVALPTMRLQLERWEAARGELEEQMQAEAERGHQAGARRSGVAATTGDSIMGALAPKDQLGHNRQPWFNNARCFRWGGQAGRQLEEHLIEHDIEDIACGKDPDRLQRFFVARTKTGKLLSWGNAENGRLGLGRPAYDQRTPTLMKPLDEQGVCIAQVAAGMHHACAVSSQGDVWTWGYMGDDGMCEGLDLNEQKPENKESWPQWAQKQAENLPTNAAAAAAPPDGVGRPNANANANSNQSDNPFGNAMANAGRNPFAAAAGAEDGVGGEVIAENDAEEEGDEGEGPEEDSGCFFVPHLVQALSRVKVTAVDCGADYSAALSADGQVYTWGAGSAGQLGHGEDEDRGVPSLVRALAPTAGADAGAGGSAGAGAGAGAGGGSGAGAVGGPGQGQAGGYEIASLACGSEHMLVLAASGEVFAWGCNEDGRIGTGEDSAGGLQLEPVLVEALREEGCEVVHVAAGEAHSGVVTADGEIYTWGLASDGQLGHTSNTEKPPEYLPQPTLVPFFRDLGARVVQLVLTSYSAARTDEGLIYSWGRGDQSGMYGTPKSSTKDYEPQLQVQLAGRNHFRIVCSKSQNFALVRPVG